MTFQEVINTTHKKLAKRDCMDILYHPNIAFMFFTIKQKKWKHPPPFGDAPTQLAQIRLIVIRDLITRAIGIGGHLVTIDAIH